MHGILGSLIGCILRRAGRLGTTCTPTRIASFVVVAALGACAQVPRLPHKFASEHAEVHARSLEHAEAVAEWIGEISPKVQEKLGIRRKAPRVYVAPEILPEGAQGLCYSTHIVVDGRLPCVEMQIVLHEIAHWYSEPLRGQLSQPLFEGLADAMVVEIDRDHATGYLWFRLSRALANLTTPGVEEESGRQLGTPTRRWYWGRPKTTAWAAAIGYVLVTRIGIERLSELCADSRRKGERTVPLARLLEAAGFERIDTAEMRTILEEMLRDAERNLVFTGLIPPP